MADIKKEVESLLFSSGKVISEKDLSELIGAKPSDVKKALETLKADYDTRDTSITLMQTLDGWKMNVKEQFVSLVTKIVADTELDFPLLETLSVIAYRAPAWQAEVIKARETNAYEHIQTLIEAGFVERIKQGRSFTLGLTQKFFDYFDVPGEQKLKMLLKDVKPRETKPKLGKLEVVDALPAEQTTLTNNDDEKKEVQKQETLGELKVVPTEVKPQEMFKPDNDFLKSIDERINSMSKQNDEHDEDEMFKKQQNPEGESVDNYDEKPVAEGEDVEVTGSQKSNAIFGSSNKRANDEEDSEKSDDVLENKEDDEKL